MEEKNFTDPRFQVEEEDSIDVMELLRKLLKEWKLVLKWCGVAVVVGLIVAFSLPKEYTVHSKMMPEIISKSGGGSLSSLASLAGIKIGSMSTTDAVYPELYPDIVSSTPFVLDLFPVQVEFKHKKEMMTADYYTYLKEYTHGPWWGAILSLPGKALGWFMGLFREKQEKIEGYAELNPTELTYEQAGIAKAIRSGIQLSVDKKTSIITLSVTAQDPKVAARVAEEIVARLQSFVTSYRTEKSRQDLDYFQTLYDEAKANYYTAQQRYANYVDRNQNVVHQRVLTERQRLQNEMDLSFQLYNACAQQLQSSKAEVQQETPVFTVIDPPQVPLQGTPSKAKVLMVAVFLGAIAAAVWILWGRDIVAGFKKKDEES